MRVLVTGDRDWSDREIVYETIASLGPGHCVVHGAAIGADEMAGWSARELGLVEEPHPAKWYPVDPRTGKTYFFKGAGSTRNVEMLETQPDVVIAFHNSLLKSKGTRHCVTAAVMRGFKVNLVALDDLGRYVSLEIVPPSKMTFSKSSQFLEQFMSSFSSLE